MCGEQKCKTAAAGDELVASSRPMTARVDASCQSWRLPANRTHALANAALSRAAGLLDRALCSRGTPHHRSAPTCWSAPSSTPGTMAPRCVSAARCDSRNRTGAHRVQRNLAKANDFQRRPWSTSQTRRRSLPTRWSELSAALPIQRHDRRNGRLGPERSETGARSAVAALRAGAVVRRRSLAGQAPRSSGPSPSG